MSAKNREFTHMTRQDLHSSTLFKSSIQDSFLE